MIAHVLNEEGLIVNTIEVLEISTHSPFGILVEATQYGGGIGDSILNGILVPKPAESEE